MNVSSGFPVYVAAPYVLAPHVRELHVKLRAVGCEPRSQWAEAATGPEALRDATARAHADAWVSNHIDLVGACAVLAVTDTTLGAEMFAEIQGALDLRRPVLWTGPRRTLSAYAPLVWVCTMADALALLADVARIEREAGRPAASIAMRGAVEARRAAAWGLGRERSAAARSESP